MNACLDTDVLVDFFNGLTAAADEFDVYDHLFVSRISWIEVLVGASGSEARKIREHFFHRLSIIELDERIALEAIVLRQKYRLKLPDAVVWATARVHGALLVTRNTKDFSAADPGIRIPYRR